MYSDWNVTGNQVNAMAADGLDSCIARSSAVMTLLTTCGKQAFIVDPLQRTYLNNLRHSSVEQWYKTQKNDMDIQNQSHGRCFLPEDQNIFQVLLK